MSIEIIKIDARKVLPYYAPCSTVNRGVRHFFGKRHWRLEEI